MKARVLGAVIATVGMLAVVQPATAVQFTWKQTGGFLYPGADASETLSEGSFFGADGPPQAGYGGLEFFDPAVDPDAPADTYAVIGWGCVLDGNNSPGATNCANGGAAANAVVGVDPSLFGNGRSALTLEVYDSGASGVLDSVTETPVVISRLNHVNNVIDDESNFLKEIVVRANLVINANPEFESPNDVGIGFLETQNRVLVTDCTQPNPLGSRCDDQFTFDVGAFNNVEFTHDGENYFLHFGLQPPPECATDITGDPLATIRIFQCNDVAGHKIAIDFINGIAWAQEGFDNAILVTMWVTEEPIKRLDTATQGGWGAPPRGRNYGKLLANNFVDVFGGSVVIGSNTGFELTFTSAAAIQAFLPQGGKPAALTESATDPDEKITVFAGQVLALTLNVAFSDAGILPAGLGSLILTSGPATGKTVNEVLADANIALGGGPLPSYVTSISQLNQVVTSINEMF
jgi:hypothetical protein